MLKRHFEIQHPDENGDVWIVSPKGEPNAWGHNLGPVDDVAEAFSQWLGSIDYMEKPPADRSE